MSDLPPAERPPLMPWWVLPSLAGAVLAIFAGSTVGVFLIGDANLLIAMAQAIINLTMMALGYYFGSSAGSQKKDETIAAQTRARNAQPDQPVAIAINNPEARP